MKEKLLCLLAVFIFGIMAISASEAIINVSITGEVASKLDLVDTSIDKLFVVSDTDDGVLSLADLNAIRDKFKDKAASSFTIDLSQAKFAGNAIPNGSGNGKGAFDLGSSYFSCLKEVILPADLKIIGDRAFRYCDKLAVINLPDGLERIGDLAFAQSTSKANSSLKLTELPNSIQTIGQYAFQLNTNLALVKLPDALEGTIAARTFSHTPIAISEIPEGVTAIDGGAFNPEADSRARITSITFPSTLQVLNATAFAKQSKITTIIFKSAIPPFATDATPFSSITNPSSVSVIVPYGKKDVYETYAAFTGMAIIEAEKEDPGEEPGEGELHVVHSIVGEMAAEIEAALEATAPATIKIVKIKGEAVLNFDDCRAIAMKFPTTDLDTLDLSAAKFLNDSTPAYSQSGSGAFYEMKMRTILLPQTLRVLGDRTFMNCTGLGSVTLPPLLKKIGFAAFAGCSTLTIEELPAGLESLSGYAFQNCPQLALTRLPAGLKGEIGTYAFYKTKVAITQIPYGITAIGNAAFGNVNTITEISFPSTLVSIGTKAFEKANALRSISIKKDNPPATTIDAASHSFLGIVLNDITLHVPRETTPNFAFEPWDQMNLVDDAEEEVILENPYVVNTSYEGRQRKYLVYRPKNYKEEIDGMLVTCHGFGGKMENALPIYGFQAAADALNLIVVSPQALPEEDQSLQNTAGSVGFDLTATWGQVLYAEVLGIKAHFNKDVNDIAFIREIIQKIGAKYSANMDNVFIGGISMGGYLAYAYSLRHGDELAGMINITGSMGLKVDTTDVTASLPILDFHSTTDGVVFYEGEGNYKGSALLKMKNAMPKQKVLEYWAHKNGITEASVTTDLGTSRNVSFKKIHYQQEGKPEVLHYQLTGADHGYNLTSTDPVTQSAEIKSFLERHMNEKIITSVKDKKTDFSCMMTGDIIYIEGLTKQTTGYLYNSLGRIISVASLQPDIRNSLNLEHLQDGFYLFRVGGDTIKFLRR